MEVRVASLADAKELAQGWADLVISLVDPGVDLPHFDTHHHVIRCADTDGITDPWSPKYDDIVEALDLCHPDSKILIHCEGGISRSTGLAIGVLVKFGLDIPSACDYVREQRPNMAPNSLILQHCDKYLQLNRQLTTQLPLINSLYDKHLMLWCSECKVYVPDIEGTNCPGKHFC